VQCAVCVCVGVQCVVCVCVCVCGVCVCVCVCVCVTFSFRRQQKAQGGFRFQAVDPQARCLRRPSVLSYRFSPSCPSSPGGPGPGQRNPLLSRGSLHL